MPLYVSERRRKRDRAALVRNGLALAVLLGAGALGYRIGVQQTNGSTLILAEQVKTLKQDHAALQQGAIRSDAAARTAQTQYQELLNRFQRQVPTGQVRELAAMVAERLEAGVSAERLAFFIRAAEEVRDCSDPESKSFVVSTPTHQDARGSTAFADGRITVAGMGTNAVGDDGAPQGMFDPARPIKVTFTLIGGKQSEVTGRLPLYHSVVLVDQEYRFAIAESEPSAVQVTADSCALP